MQTQPRKNDDFHSSRPPLSNQAPKAVGIFAILILVVSFISGCAAERLRIDYKGYENSYSESSNRQLLLNLARLNQHHPTYFFKFGPISTTYRTIGTLTGNASQVAGPYTNPLNKTITGGGTTGVTLEQDPTFTFIPISDDIIAQQLLQPIQAEHFYVLFQQGWRLDQLMRLMVNRIEFTPAGSKSVQVIRNTPSLDNVKGYLTFLRISALAYELQRKGHLVVTGRSNYHVIMTNLELQGVQAKDITDAQAKGFIWKKTADGKFWELGQNVIEPVFQLNPPDLNVEKNRKESDKICPTADLPPSGYNPPTTPDDLLKCEIRNDPDVAILAQADSLPITLGILKTGFVVTGQSGADIQTEKDQSGSAQFVMRSLIGAMAAASEEEVVFETILNSKDAATQDPIPPAEKQPLMNLTWEGEKRPLTHSLVELDYLGQTYKVADVEDKDPLIQSSWNRDMFRIISQLSSEVTVDISKFPLPSVLQLRPF